MANFVFSLYNRKGRRAAAVLYAFEYTEVVRTSGIRHSSRWKQISSCNSLLLLVHPEYCVILFQIVVIPKVEAKLFLLHTLGNLICGGQGPDATGGLVGYKITLRQVSLNV